MNQAAQYIKDALENLEEEDEEEFDEDEDME